MNYNDKSEKFWILSIFDTEDQALIRIYFPLSSSKENTSWAIDRRL